MKKIFKTLIAVILLPFAFFYGIFKVVRLNKLYFKNLVKQRSLERQAQVYRKNYKTFQLELVKNED